MKRQRRTLRFDTVDDAIAEADRLVAADRDGRLTRTGTWELGQMLGHLATWAGFSFDGYPPEVGSPPAPVRWIGRLVKNRTLTKGMMAGMKIGRVPGGTVATDKMPPDEGLSRFRAAMERLRDNDPAKPNPVFGPLTHEQWIQLNLRHAELHMSFLHPS
jgi:hypothetical protein